MMDLCIGRSLDDRYVTSLDTTTNRASNKHAANDDKLKNQSFAPRKSLNTYSVNINGLLSRKD